MKSQPVLGVDDYLARFCTGVNLRTCLAREGCCGALAEAGPLGLCAPCAAALPEAQGLLELAAEGTLTQQELEGLRDEALASAGAREALEAALAAHGLVRVQVRRDGNCLFSAAADQLWGEPGRHAELRAACADYLVVRPHLATAGERALGGGTAERARDHAAYVADMRVASGGDGAYGGRPELRALAALFERRVCVLAWHGAMPLEEWAAPLALEEGVGGGAGRGLRAAALPLPEGPLIVLLQEGCHFNSVRAPDWRAHLLPSAAGDR